MNRTERVNSPSPNRYHMKSEFDMNEETRKGYTFGTAERDAYTKSKVSKTIPGPGSYTYNINKYINLAFSMGGKT